VGFLSHDFKKLNSIKNRPFHKEVLSVVDSFGTLKKHTRIPNKYKNRIRRATLTTFIYPNKKSFRLVDKNSPHYNFVKKHNIIYSTSANIHNQTFNKDFAILQSDIIIYQKDDFQENNSSHIFKLSNHKISKIR
jgi:tRNA A37 threonylcarbamoyladenosine synthetase subunit TsaC/SUA5/YrdC